VQRAEIEHSICSPLLGAPPRRPMESSLLAHVTISRGDRQPKAYRFMVGDNSDIEIL